MKIYINKKEDISDRLAEEEVVLAVVEGEVVGKVAEEEVVQKVPAAEAMVGRVVAEMEVVNKAVLQILQAKAHQAQRPLDIQLPTIQLFLFNTTHLSTLNMEYIFYYLMKRLELILKYS